jgi:hypothetical protein
MTGLLSPLTRPELDTLIAVAEHADKKAHLALVVASTPETVRGAAAVAGDCMRLYVDALDESTSRFTREMASYG